MTSAAEARPALPSRFREAVRTRQTTADGIPTWWIDAGAAHDALAWLKRDAPLRYDQLYDLTVIDERRRKRRAGQPHSDFTLVYHLWAVGAAEQVRLKVPLEGNYPTIPTITDLWPCADWYEREAFDMFGLRFDGHPNLRRILMPPTWEGHPLRKEHPARATELPRFDLTAERRAAEEEALQVDPEAWGLTAHAGADTMFLNVGPQHPGTHGVLRVVLLLDGEEIVDCAPDIGFHHRGAEKMGERQSWHTYIPYTDRVDYLGGVMNNLPYVLAVERLAGITVPDRVKTIRVMLCELFRVASHLVWLGTYLQDLGAMSPVFYAFNERERVLRVVEAITGGRMHPNWLRIGGVAQDLPGGWDTLVRETLDALPKGLDELTTLLTNRIVRARSEHVGAYTTAEAIEWGVTGPGLRATGLEWDLRKRRPYSGYEWFDFEVPTATGGDCYARALVRDAEIRQSLRIVRQCVDHMPEGLHKAVHPLTTPPVKDRTMKDIETLINHFLSVSWGPVLPPGEASVAVEGTKGLYSYYLVSDGDNHSYRTRIRTPSFPHLQMLPKITRGHTVPDLLAILGSLDYVLADVDR